MSQSPHDPDASAPDDILPVLPPHASPPTPPAGAAPSFPDVEALPEIEPLPLAPPARRTPLTTEPVAVGPRAGSGRAAGEIPRGIETKPQRLVSLDVFRGITIAGMILVNNPGTWSAIYSPLGHAPWHGLTPTDLVFPFFLFIVGVALPMSFDRRIAEGASRLRLFEHVLRRSLIIFALGMILTTFPRWPALANPALPTDWRDLLVSKIVLGLTPAASVAAAEANLTAVLPHLLAWRLMAPYVLLIIGLALLFAHEPPLGWPRRFGAQAVKVLGGLFLLGAVGYFAADFGHFQAFRVRVEPPAGVRVPGVLQRIALCYFFASLIVMFFGVRGRVLWTAGILAAYWAIVAYVPAPAEHTMPDMAARPEGVLHDWIDVKLLGVHLYSERPDPEGLLSTLPAIATVLIGVLAGNWLRARPEQRTADEAHSAPGARMVGGAHPTGAPAAAAAAGANKAGWLFVWANVLLVLGLWMALELPLNKKIWTSSYVVVTGGLALHFLAFCYWLIDVKGYRAWAKPFVVFGTNAIAVYVASGIAARLLNSYIVPGTDGKSLWAYVQNSLQGGLTALTAPLPAALHASPQLASMLQALLFVALWCLLLVPLYRARIFIKI